MAKSNKRYSAVAEKVDSENFYPLADAFALVKETASTKFDESVDVAINLGIDAKKSDQAVRGATVLPKGTGKTVRVAVFTDGDNVASVVGQLGQILGPKGLMPNPKTGTVAADVATAVRNAKAGQVQYRIDKAGIIQTTIGKASFSAEDLQANFEALLAALHKAKPALLLQKGNILSVYQYLLQWVLVYVLIVKLFHSSKLRFKTLEDKTFDNGCLAADV